MKKALETRAIISRKSWYIEQIFDCTKKYDFWKVTPRYVTCSYLLCEKETKNIVGEIVVKPIARFASVDCMEKVFEKGMQKGLTQKSVQECKEYIKNDSTQIWCLEIKKVQKFVKPIPIEKFSVKKLSVFSYITEDVYQNAIQDNERIVA